MWQETAEDDIAGYAVCDRQLPSSDEELREACRQATGGSGCCTLIGDAAHPMSPFKGQGANQALLDAVLLAQELSWSVVGPPELQRGGSDAGGGGGGSCATTIRRTVDEALLAYERAMFARVAPKVTASREAVDILHSSLAVAVDLNETTHERDDCNGLNVDAAAAEQSASYVGAVGARAKGGGGGLRSDESRHIDDESGMPSTHRRSGESYDATWREERVWAVQRLKEAAVGAWCGSDLDASVVRALSAHARSATASSAGESPDTAVEQSQSQRHPAGTAVIGAPPAAYCAKVRRSRDRTQGSSSLGKGKVPRVAAPAGSSVQ